MAEFNVGDRVYSRNPQRDHNDHDTVYVVKERRGYDYDLVGERDPRKGLTDRGIYLVPVGSSSGSPW
jgi:hypothetical protein